MHTSLLCAPFTFNMQNHNVLWQLIHASFLEYFSIAVSGIVPSFENYQ